VSCTMTRPCDVHWLCREAGRFFPRQWQRYREGGGNSGDLVTACGKLLSAHPIPLSGNARPGTGATGRTRPAPWKEGRAPGERFTGPRFRMIFARLCAHYFSHAAWLPDGQQLLRDARRLAGIPGVMIHGRFGVQGTSGRAVAAPPGLAGLRTASGRDRAPGRRGDDRARDGRAEPLRPDLAALRCRPRGSGGDAAADLAACALLA